MANIVPDYSQYIAVKKIGVAQTANTNTSIVKGRSPYRYDGYFPLYRGIKLPVNALLPNKLVIPPGPAPPFVPTEVAGISLWLDAADASSIVLSGSNVSSWKDKSGSGNNATAVGTTLTHDINTGVYFPGTSLFTSPLLATSNTETGFVIFNNTNPGTGYQNILAPVLTYNRELIIQSAAEGYVMTINSQNMNLGNAVTSTAPSKNTDVIVSYNTTSIIVINGTTAGTGNALVNGTGGTTGTTTRIGSRDGNPATATYKFIGYIKEIVIYNAVLTTANRQKIEGYLAWKWGLQGNLPANHPYKSTKP